MMRDKVTIAYRGAAYELGRGKDYYALWAAGAARAEPVERWPDTPDGWIAAWTRFTTLETPGTITAAGRGRAARLSGGGAVVSDGMTAVLPMAPGTPDPTPQTPAGEAGLSAPRTEEPRTEEPRTEQAAPLIPEPALPVTDPAADGALTQPVTGPADGTFAQPAGGSGGGGTFAQAVVTAGAKSRMLAPVASALLTIGVILGVIGLFPTYYQGASVAGQPPLLVTHVAYLAGWTIAAVLLLLGGVRQRAGALLATGLSAVTIGLLLTDLFNATTAHVALGAGTWLGLAGWALCAAGAVAGLLAGPARQAAGWISRPRGLDVARVAVLGLAGIGAAITFAPAWDTFLLRTASGQTQSFTMGNAFSSPGLVIAANVAVMVLFALVVVAASLWRPVHLGAVLLAGAVLPMAAQTVSALVQVSEPTSPTQFGISPQQAAQAGLTITNGVTAWFWVFCMLIVVLVASFAWMLITPQPATQAQTQAQAQPQTAPGAVVADPEADWDDQEDDWDTAGTGWEPRADREPGGHPEQDTGPRA